MSLPESMNILRSFPPISAAKKNFLLGGMLIDLALANVDEIILKGIKDLGNDLTLCCVSLRLDEASVDEQLGDSHLPPCLASAFIFFHRETVVASFAGFWRHS